MKKSTDGKSSKVNNWVDQVNDTSDREKKVDVLEEFSQNASVHGIRHTSSGNHGKFRRWFWALAFLGMLGGLLYTVLFQVIRMMSYPTITQQRMEFKSGLPFPAVTLCNLNHFRKSVVGNDTRMQLFQLAMSDLGSFAAPINWSDPIWNYEEDEQLTDEILSYVGHPLYYTLKFCSWDNQPFNCLERFKLQKTDFGMCFTFNGRDDLNSTPLMSIRAGSKYGLTVVADIMQYEYMLSSDNDVAGLRVVLHHPDETPSVEGRGFDVGPGTATKASLTYKQVNYLPPPYKLPHGDECVNISGNFENFLTLFDRYDIYACMEECRQKYILKTCGCRGIFDRSNATVCHPKDLLDCYIPTSEYFMYNSMGWLCHCPIPCTWNLYEAKISVADFPSIALMQQIKAIYNISATDEEFRQNYLKLTLTYDNFVLESINQLPEFNFESVMSTLGGQLGIFLGASLISLLEFLELGLELLFFKVLKIGNQKKH